MSDRIAVMKGGRIHQVDAPQRIYERPKNRFVADFIGDTNFLMGEVKAGGRGSATVLVDGELTLRLPVERVPGPSEEVTVAIRPEKIALHGEPPEGQHVPGTVEEVIYVGTETHYIVRVTQNTTVFVRMQNVNPHTDLTFPEGKRVYLSWQREAARVLTGEE